MTFLPIAERELRVAARKRGAFWARVASALVAGVIGAGFLLLSLAGLPFGPTGLGKALFAALTWLCLAAALSTGLFFTSDCLSEEKREGTLGFLFLTDLSGYDIVLGKLLATSLRALYGLLAVFPVLAVTLLMGGVTGAQFWKTVLALFSALLVSSAAGLFVSAISRKSQNAFAGTLMTILLLNAAGPAGDAAWAELNHRAFNPLLSLSSPGFLFMTAGAWGRTPYWAGLAANQIVMLLLLALACLLLPRLWQQRRAEASVSTIAWTLRAWKFGSTRGRLALRQKLLERNPVLWLACRERWHGVVLWALAIVFAAGLAAYFIFGPNSGSFWFAWMLWSYCASIVNLLLYVAMAYHAGRFFVEAIRNGVFELLLETPLTARQIVQGQWRATLRIFGAPVILFVAAQTFASILQLQMSSGMSGPSVPGINLLARGPLMILISVCGSLAVLANLAAVIWFGMWTGLSSKNANLSALKTLLFVQIIPWFAVSFASALLIPLLMFRSGFQQVISGVSFMNWLPLLLPLLTTLLFLGKDVGFLYWSRHKLHSQLRDRVSRTIGLPRPKRMKYEG